MCRRSACQPSASVRSVAAMAAVRSPAFVALAARAAWLPTRGRWAVVLGGQAVEAVARAAFCSLGLPVPPGLPRVVAVHLANLSHGGHAAFTIDDISSSLAAAGLPIRLQEGLTCLRAGTEGPG